MDEWCLAAFSGSPMVIFFLEGSFSSSGLCLVIIFTCSAFVFAGKKMPVSPESFAGMLE
jgi:hypothetical protein